MKMLDRHNTLQSSGFALPAVVIASIVMMMVLIGGASAALAGTGDLKQQYHDRLMRSAGEAGLKYAQYCLGKGTTINWPLTPYKDCSGGNTPCAASDTCFVLNDTDHNLKTSFSVAAPDSKGIMKASGILYSVRSSNGTIVSSESRTVSQANIVRSPGQIAVAMSQATDKRATVFTNSDGKIYGMGDNVQNRFTTNAPSGTVVNVPTLVDLPAGVTYAKKIISGGYGTPYWCMIASNDGLYCRGLDSATVDSPIRPGDAGWQKMNLPAGVTVDTSYADNYNQDPTKAGALYGVSFGIWQGGQVCVTASNGNAYCAGSNSYGQLASGRTPTQLQGISLGGYTRINNVSSSSPITLYPVTRPVGMTKVVSVMTRGGTTCIQGLPDITKVYCAGRNDFGQLGRGTTGAATVAAHATPAIVNMPAGVGVTQVLPGNQNSTGHFVVFLGSDGQVYGTGSNASYVLGNGTTTNTYPTPVLISQFGNQNRLVMTGTVHISAARADGSVWSTGANNNRQLGNNTATTNNTASQFLLPAGEQANYIKMRTNTDIWYNRVYQTVVLTQSGKVFSAGDNLSGQFGSGLGAQVAYPTQFNLPAGVQAESVSSDGYTGICILGSDKKFYCAGSNNSGQLGNGSTNNSSLPVQPIMPNYPVYY